MSEYSYSDLVKMQDQAIRRVREMQERARLTVKENPIPELEAQPDESTERFDRPKTPAKSQETEKPPKKQNQSHALDKDKAILLPLIMLLSHEGADNILMIALLYILS